jgi:hypothetical protein
MDAAPVIPPELSAVGGRVARLVADSGQHAQLALEHVAKVRGQLAQQAQRLPFDRRPPAVDDSPAVEALNLADGSDIHKIAGLVATFRSLAREGLDASDLERELRRYVARKRQDRLRREAV